MSKDPKGAEKVVADIQSLKAERKTPADDFTRRIRAAVGSALGIADEASLTPEALAVAVERICARAAETPNVSLLARDLTERE